MTNNSPIRRGALAASVAGVAWALSSMPALFFSIQQTGEPGSFADFYIETLHFIAEACILLALLGLRDQTSKSMGKLGAVSLWLAFAGDALLFALTLLFVVLLFAGAATGVDYGSMIGDAIPSVLFILGLIGTVVGCISLGLVLIRGKMFVWWIGGALIAYPILFFLALFNYAVFLPIGLIWIGVGSGMRRGKSVPA